MAEVLFSRVRVYFPGTSRCDAAAAAVRFVERLYPPHTAAATPPARHAAAATRRRRDPPPRDAGPKESNERVSGKTANMAAIFGTRTERRRTAAARAVAGSGLNEKDIEKGCTLSVLLTEQRTRTAKERHMATRVDHVRDELKALRAYGRLGRAKARLGEANTLTSDDFLDDAGGGNVLVGGRRAAEAEGAFGETLQPGL